MKSNQIRWNLMKWNQVLFPEGRYIQMQPNETKSPRLSRNEIHLSAPNFILFDRSKHPDWNKSEKLAIDRTWINHAYSLKRIVTASPESSKETHGSEIMRFPICHAICPGRKVGWIKLSEGWTLRVLVSLFRSIADSDGFCAGKDLAFSMTDIPEPTASIWIGIDLLESQTIFFATSTLFEMSWDCGPEK
jgi:hypothetical protein